MEAPEIQIAVDQMNAVRWGAPVQEVTEVADGLLRNSTPDQLNSDLSRLPYQGWHRKGKNMILCLARDSGTMPELAYQLHLNATGWLYPHNDLAMEWHRRNGERVSGEFRHSSPQMGPRALFHFPNGHVWSLKDSRSWARMYRWPFKAVTGYGVEAGCDLARYGPDVMLDLPLCLDVAERWKRDSSRPLKSVLTDQYVVSGAGPRLVREGCRRAGILSDRSWKDVPPDGVAEVLEEINQAAREVLENQNYDHFCQK